MFLTDPNINSTSCIPMLLNVVQKIMHENFLLNELTGKLQGWIDKSWVL